MNDPGVVTAVVEWIHHGQWDGLEPFANELWDQVDSPKPRLR